MTTNATETRTSTSSQPPSAPAQALSRPIKTQRRWSTVALGLAIIALGGLAGYWYFNTTADTVAVVAVSGNVSRGEVIDRNDLVTVDAAPNTAIATVPAEQIDTIVGARATADLLAGSLLNPAAISDAIAPAAGESLVGVALLPNQLPAEPLIPGDHVRVVDTPNPGDPPPKDTPDSISAAVLAVSGPTDTGHMMVDVLVEEAQSSDLVARVATGRVALVLDARERGQ